MIPVTSATHFPSRSRQSNKIARFGFLTSRFMGIILLAILALLYIAQSSQGATKSIQYHELTDQEKQLQNNIQDLDLLRKRDMTLQSLQDQVGKLPADQQLEAVKDIEFLTPATALASPAP